MPCGWYPIPFSAFQCPSPAHPSSPKKPHSKTGVLIPKRKPKKEEQEEEEEEEEEEMNIASRLRLRMKGALHAEQTWRSNRVQATSKSLELSQGDGNGQSQCASPNPHVRIAVPRPAMRSVCKTEQKRWAYRRHLTPVAPVFDDRGTSCWNRCIKTAQLSKARQSVKSPICPDPAMRPLSCAPVPVPAGGYSPHQFHIQSQTRTPRTRATAHDTTAPSSR